MLFLAIVILPSGRLTGAVLFLVVFRLAPVGRTLSSHTGVILRLMLLDMDLIKTNHG